MKKAVSKIKTKTVLYALCAILCAAPLMMCPPSVEASNDATVKSYKDQLADLQAEQDRLMTEIDSLRSQAAQSAEYKASLDQLASTTQYKIVLSNNLLTQLSNQISMTEDSITETEAQMSETMNKYLERVKETYEDGNASYLELILGSQNISDFLSRIDRINSILEYDRSLMDKYNEQKQSLEDQKKALENSKAAEEKTNAELAADEASYESLSAQQDAYISSLTQSAEDKLAMYNKVAEAERQLNAELESYIQQQQAQNQVIYSGEGFIRPIAGGTGYVSSGYGWRDLWGQSDFHGAVDVACPAGTPIMASSGGTVIRAEWHWSYGNYVIIDHGDGISTLYAHCSALLVSVGTQVSQGDTIALVGMTGSADGNHVHVEVRINGQRVDPNGYIAF